MKPGNNINYYPRHSGVGNRGEAMGDVKAMLVGLARKVPAVRRRLNERGFKDSGSYWDRRYQTGGNSGEGSYGRLAVFKAEFLNALVEREGVSTVLEFGVGDGAQLELAEYPSYRGLDVSPTAIAQCRERFAGDDTKVFTVHDALTDPLPDRAELTLSLDVIYHLVEDRVFEAYMGHLFDSAERLVVVYASNKDERLPTPHVRHRRFTDWVETNRPAWQMVEHTPNRYPEGSGGSETSFADFYTFTR